MKNQEGPRVPARIEPEREMTGLRIEVMKMLEAENPDFKNFLESISSLVTDASVEELEVVSKELKAVHRKIGGDGIFGKDIIDWMVDKSALGTAVTMGGSFAYFLYSAAQKDMEGMRNGILGIGVSSWVGLIAVVRAWSKRENIPAYVVKQRRMAVRLLGELVEARIAEMRQNAGGNSEAGNPDLKRIEPSNEKPFSMD